MHTEVVVWVDCRRTILFDSLEISAHRFGYLGIGKICNAPQVKKSEAEFTALAAKTTYWARAQEQLRATLGALVHC